MQFNLNFAVILGRNGEGENTSEPLGQVQSCLTSTMWHRVSRKVMQSHSDCKLFINIFNWNHDPYFYYHAKGARVIPNTYSNSNSYQN